MCRRRIRSLVAWLSPCLLVSLAPCLPVAGAFDAAIDSPMYRDPDVPVPPVVTVFSEKAKDLWLKALARPEVDMKASAAAAIARARRRGAGGLEVTVGPLRAALELPDQHPAVVLAAAEALIALDAREAASELFAAAQAGGSDLRDLIEPALARWDYKPARAVWLRRLQGDDGARSDLILAIRGLAEVREGQAAESLRRMVLSGRTAGPVRLEAARALGRLGADGLEKDAEALTADASPRGLVARLAAASLLLHRQGEPAVGLLQRLAADPEPAVVSLAAGRLLEIDPQLLVPSLGRLLGSPDAGARAIAVEVLRRRPTAESVRPLAERLDDRHPGVRVAARAALRELAARKELRDGVTAEASRVLAGKSWRGQEQAAILLTQLDFKPAAGRLVALLASDRPEVYVTAAWGLRKLDVAETLAAVAQYDETARAQFFGTDAASVRPGAGRSPQMIDHQLSQLNQFLGRRRYAPADPLLRRSLPRPGGMPVAPESRAAALWALGWIHEGRPVPDLVTAVAGRLNDIGPLIPEAPEVRWMAAVALARLGARQSVPSLRKYYRGTGPTADHLSNACGWALEQLTGEKMPAAKPGRLPERDGFLNPGG